MKKFIKKLIYNKTFSGLIIKPILKLHSLNCFYADVISTVLENGVHPKHRIIKYKEWFFEHIKPGWIVLDIGCNNGMMDYLIAEKAKFVYAIDINQEHIIEARLKRQKPNIEYICANALKYDFTKYRGIDCVILSNIIEHIEERATFLKTLVNCLDWNDKNDRRFLFRVPMINRDWLVLYKKELGIDYRSDKTHFIEYTFEEFQEELSQAHLKMLESDIKFGEICALCQVI